MGEQFGEKIPGDRDLGADFEKSLSSTQEVLKKEDEKKVIQESREAAIGETEPYSGDEIKEKRREDWVDIAGGKLLKAIDWLGDRICSGGDKVEIGVRKLRVLGLTPEMAVREMAKKVFSSPGKILERMRDFKTKRMEKRMVDSFNFMLERIEKDNSGEMGGYRKE